MTTLENDIRRIAVIGAGAMGCGIAQWAADAGANVLLFDAATSKADAAKKTIEDTFSRLVAKGRLNAEQKTDRLNRIEILTDLKQVSQADLVVEAIVEDLSAKQALFQSLEDVVQDNVIISTNTSSLSVTSCAKVCKNPSRVAGLHFFNPVPLMRVVEIIKAERTSSETVDRLTAFVKSTKHHATICSDSPGFVVNHAGRGLYTEGIRVVQEGVATFEDVDDVVRDCLGLPMGPFELFDLTGLDVSSRVLREIYEAFFQDPRYRPAPFIYRRVEAGLFGRKNGEGFYRYANGTRLANTGRQPPKNAVGRIHIGITDSIFNACVTEILTRGGTEIAPNAEDADAIIVAPWGHDATLTAVSKQLDPYRLVAIDPLSIDAPTKTRRMTLMCTPVTRPGALDCVHTAVLKGNVSATCISDSPGFIAQRVAASIVNTACEIAQQRIATPADIEEGVRRGLGYPIGPLALGDLIGAVRIVKILECLQLRTGDPRYRPSLWLRRRAELKVPLTLV